MTDSTTGYGLTIRWSLHDAPAGVESALTEYVTETSIHRFTGMEGLRFKTWRMRPGEWFEGTYVWETAQARDAFAAEFAAEAATSPGSRIIGSAPILQETWDVVAVAEGGAGFRTG